MNHRGFPVRLVVGFLGVMVLLAGVYRLISRGTAIREQAGEGVPRAVPDDESHRAPGGDTLPFPGNPTRPAGWTILGRLVRSLNGAGGPRPNESHQPIPVKRAVVRFEIASDDPAAREGSRKNTTSGIDGRFEVPGLSPKEPFLLAIDEAESALESLRIDYPQADFAGRVDLGDIPLSAASTLTVRLLGSKSETLEGGEVTCNFVHVMPAALERAGIRYAKRSAKATGGGLYRFDRLPPGTYSLHARVPGHAQPDWRWVDVPVEGIVSMSLLDALRIAGTVRAADGKPIAGARVEACVQREEVTTTDANGRFIIDSATPTRRTSIRVQAEGFAGAHLWAHPGNEDIQVWLVPEGVVKGQVIMEDGTPSIGAEVNIETAGDFGNQFHSESDFHLNPKFSDSVQVGANGVFEARRVPPGTYRAIASRNGMVPARAEPIELRSGERVDGIVLRLQGGLSLKGKVVAQETGKPVPGASIGVSLEAERPEVWISQNAESGENGEFQTRGLIAGEYKVSAKAPGYAAAWVTVHIDPTTPGEIEKPIELFPPREKESWWDVARGGVRGRVVDADGRGIAAATVGERSNPHVMTDDDGRYTLRRLREGSVWIRARAPGRISGDLQVLDVRAGEVVEAADIVLGKGETLTGRVLDSEGQTVQAAEVRLDVDGGDGETTTGGDGRFALTGLPAGRARVQVRKDGFDGQETMADVPGEEQVLRLERLATVKGLVRGESPHGFAMGQVQAGQINWDGDRFDLGEWSWIDPTGRFRLDLPAGSYVFRFSIPGFALVDLEVNLRAGEQREGLVINLDRGGTISGVVLGSGGSRAAEARVRVEKVEGFIDPVIPEAVAGLDGRFTLEHLPAGRVELSASGGGRASTTVRPGKTSEVTIDIPRTGSIAGIVSRNGMPVSDLPVGVWFVHGGGAHREDTPTDAAGRYEIHNLIPGAYDVQVVSEEAGLPLVPWKKVTVTEDGVAEANFAIDAIRLNGSVSQRGEPVEGSIAVLRPTGEVVAEGEIDSTGNFSFDLPGAGSYVIRVNRLRFDLTVPEGADQVQRDLEMPDAEIAGEVIDGSSRAPLYEANVAAFPAGTELRGIADLIRSLADEDQTDHQGRFRLGGLQQARYTLLIWKEGFVQARIDGLEAAGKGSAKKKTIALERGVPLRARLIDVQGKPVSGVRAVVREPGGQIVHPELSFNECSQASGVFVLRGLQPGSYLASFGNREHAPVQVPVQVIAGGPDLVVTTQSGGALEVSVEGEKEEPVAGANIEIRCEGNGQVVEDLRILGGAAGGSIPFWLGELRVPGIESGPDGSVIVEHLPPGELRVSCSKGSRRSGDEKVVIHDSQRGKVHLKLPARS